MHTFFSPGKINLFLRILNKRIGGYHQLASLLHAIDLGDYLTFSLGSEDCLSCSDPSLPTDKRNLIIQARELFRERTGHREPLSIHLEKAIPQQAGLGGGSSNAATTLWALNTLFDRPATLDQLMSWGSELGSDVPFFFSTGAAFCTGRGEKVEELKRLPDLGHLSLIKPLFGLSTQQIYTALDLNACSQVDPHELLEDFCSGHPRFINDLEQAAFRTSPKLKIVRDTLLEQGVKNVVLCGSGSALVCLGAPHIGHPIRLINRQQIWYRGRHESLQR